MNSPDSSNVHSLYVQELVQANDWAGLLRYWMAHLHDPALDEATTLVVQHVNAEDRRWRILAEFLEDVCRQPLDLQRKLPEDLTIGWLPPEQVTLNLLTLTPFVALCELWHRAPADQQERVLSVGVEYAKEACRQAESLGDKSLSGFFRKELAFA